MIEYEKTEGGIKAVFNQQIIGWITSTTNGLYTFIDNSKPGDNPKVESVNQAKQLFEDRFDLSSVDNL